MTSDWTKMCKKYVQNTTRIRIIKGRLHENQSIQKKLMADFKLVTKNCIESVEKTCAAENGKKFVGQCNLPQLQFGNYSLY